MTDHPSTGAGDNNLPVLSVGEISQVLKRHVEGAFEHVRVRGEISGLRRAGSGHLYFALKDDTAVLKGVCWRGTAGRLGIQPADGMDVVVTGRLTTYPGRSEYQMVVAAMDLAGEGALLKLLEDRRKRLAAEGLFDAERKRPIPFLPAVIGVVTSPTGAVIRDILHRLADRFPRRVLLWPVAVQGAGAAEQVAAAIAGFNDLAPGGAVPRPDVLIVARGGGSLEDLWAFNEEVTVRAAAASAIPVIAAVGHETDTTLIDFAADRRAPTPSAAAEMAVPVRTDLIARVMTLEARQVGAFNRLIGHGRTRLEGLARGLPRPDRLVEEARQRLDDWADRLRQSLAVGLDRRHQRLATLAAGLTSPRTRIDHERSRVQGEGRALAAAMRARIETSRRRLDHAAALLESYSYQRVLERGFVLATDPAGHAVTSARGLKPAMRLALHFHDGKADVAVAGTDGSPGPGASTSPARRRRAQGRRSDDQGTLL